MSTRDKTRGIETLAEEAASITAGEAAFVTAEAASGIWVHNETPGGSTTGTDLH